jgi:hypothetical protein
MPRVSLDLRNLSLTSSSYRFFQDPAFYSLTIVNLLSIVLAVYEQWSLFTPLFIYIIQSLTLGLINFLRIISLKEFSTKGFSISGGRAILPNEQTKWYTAKFFLLHYGGFHAFYIFFLIMFMGENETIANLVDWRWVFFTSLFFVLNHAWSFYLERQQAPVKLNIGNLMFYPYARVVPMHLTILIGLGITGGQVTTFALIFFMILKTFADLLTHILEKNVLQTDSHAPKQT